ncbi:MAG: hypothetical protein ACFBZ9_10580 [Sphingomonadales bacterium]
MTFKYGKTSEERLATCHPDLQLWARALLKVSDIDITVLAGHRNERDQMQAYYNKNTQLPWPKSKHNQQPSLAIDIAPWFPDRRVDWEFRPHFDYIAGQGRVVAKALCIGLRWGGDWDRDGDLKDNGWNDLVHWELLDAD